MLRRFLSVAIAAALLAATACGSSNNGSGSSSAPSGLAAAMASVSGTVPAQHYFEYGNLAALRNLGITHPSARESEPQVDGRWNLVSGVGSTDLANSTAILPGLIDVNVFAADTAVAIGVAPNHATRVDGAFDQKTVSAKLTALGAKPRSFGGIAGLSFGPDNTASLSGKLGAPQYGTLYIALSQVVVTDHTFAVGRNAATLEQVLAPGSRSLLDVPHFADLAGCLGDVVVAMTLVPERDSRTQLAGIGVRTPNSADAAAQDVLCVVPKSGDQDTVHRSFVRRLALDATDPTSNQPMSTYATRTAVDDTGGLVRAVLTLGPKAPTGYLIQAVEANALPHWDGSCVNQSLPGC